MRRFLSQLLVVAAAIAAGQSTAWALPMATDRGLAAPSMVQLAHGCHHHPEEGRYGWHVHRGPHCDRVAVPPPHRRHYRGYDHGPRCYQDCKYVGPIKVCKERCR